MAPETYRILIAEDEPRIVAFLEKGLRQRGYETVSTRQGDRTLELLANSEFDLLLLDLGLPGKDGWFILRALKRFNSTIPVIVITAQEDAAARLSQQSLSVSACIEKPFQFKTLLHSIERCLTPEPLAC
ncbi:MAG: response regulator [Cyanobacteria bacterium P01_E01_bin.6]